LPNAMVAGNRGLLAAFFALLLVPPGEASSLPRDLFVIERSKNANIVVYDPNRGPIKRQVNVVQWPSAYGFNVELGNRDLRHGLQSELHARCGPTTTLQAATR